MILWLIVILYIAYATIVVLNVGYAVEDYLYDKLLYDK